MDPKQYKQSLLDQLYAPYKRCQACPLGALGRTSIVFGEGNPDASLMFIGEGPGRDEDLKGRPFIGRSGQLLNRIFELSGIEREEVFITNIVKCRPPKNRQPTEIEASTCKRILLVNQIKIIKPIIICTLGSAAFQGLLGLNIPITKARGQLFTYEGTSLLPTFHPAYILRNPKELPKLASDLEKAMQFVKKNRR